jgi:hypothetical protein
VEVEQPDRRPSAKRLRGRTTDRVEDAVAWLLATLALLIMVFAVGVGIAGAADGLERARVEVAERVAVRAVLLEAADVVPTTEGATLADRVPARWVGRGDQEVTGEVHVALPLPAGTRIVIWLDKDGRVVQAPITPAAAVVMGVMEGLGAAAIGCGALVLTWLGVRRVTMACNSVAWEHEWERVEPEWSGRKRI